MPAWDETGFGVPGPKPYELHWSEEEIIKLKDDINRLRAENEKMMNRLRNPELTWAENSRLRAENAALRGIVDDYERARAILAKTAKADAAAQNDDLFQDETLRTPDRP